MLSLTKKTEYALIAVSHLARVGKGVVSAREIADRYAIRLPLLMNVLKTLNQAGLLKSVRGARGGYMLACSAESLTLAQLIRAIDGPVRLMRCVGPEDNGSVGCELHGTCPVKHPLQKVHEQLEQFLAGVTVSEVAFDEDFDARCASDDKELRVLAQ